MKLIDLPEVQPAAADESVPESDLVTKPEAEPIMEEEAGAQE